MTSRLNPYISFQDNAREAMTFYADALGTEATFSTFGEFGAADAPFANNIMHSQLETADGFTLMASDTPPGMDYQPARGITISLSGDDVDALKGYYERLSAGGEVTMPLEKQMWGDHMGSFTDKFGIGWMVNIAGDAADAATGSADAGA